MSEDNKNLPVPSDLFTDLSEKDMVKIRQFMEEGMPGLDRVNDAKLHQITDLYLSGKTYSDIASIARTNKTIILYLSHKLQLPSVRQEYLQELETSIKGRVLESKAASQNHMLKIIHMFEKRHGQKIHDYLASGDEEIVKSIDLKEVDKYLKVVEMVHEMNANPKTAKGPMVGINAGDGVTVKKTGENSIEITPNIKDKTVGSILKQFADSKRKEKENSQLPKRSDIIIETPDEQGEDVNEKE